jgi:hypothetical protein
MPHNNSPEPKLGIVTAPNPQSSLWDHKLSLVFVALLGFFSNFAFEQIQNADSNATRDRITLRQEVQQFKSDVQLQLQTLKDGMQLDVNNIATQMAVILSELKNMNNNISTVRNDPYTGTMAAKDKIDLQRQLEATQKRQDNVENRLNNIHEKVLKLEGRL